MIRSVALPLRNAFVRPAPLSRLRAVTAITRRAFHTAAIRCNTEVPSSSTPAAATTPSAPADAPPVPAHFALPLTPAPYFEAELREIDRVGYRAAGLLAYRWHEGYLHFLFGQESDHTDPRKFELLNVLGGKIDEQLDGTDARVTACREFQEECGHQLGRVTLDGQVKRLKKQQNGVLWFRQAKYALFPYEMTSRAELNIVEKYNEKFQPQAEAYLQSLQFVDRSPAASGAPDRIPAGTSTPASSTSSVVPMSEMLRLVWVEAEDLLRYLDRLPHHLSTSQRTRMKVRTIDGPPLPITAFCSKMLNDKAMREKIGQIMRNPPSKQTTRQTDVD
jgi:8-oxo-dGTP pyrophosphatase MutT (NUDIX family)